MMRLLFLCLLLPAAIASSKNFEGSADAPDDEDGFVEDATMQMTGHGTIVDKTTGEEGSTDQFTLIVIVVAVTVLALSVAVIVAVMLVRRHMHNRQQGIYSVPTEQDHKGAV